MLIIDDLISESQKNQFMEDMSTKGVHHQDCTLITIGQNLFAQGKKQRDYAKEHTVLHSV